jgi:alcohol dehydrogenase, propanol-preferring
MQAMVLFEPKKPLVQTNLPIPEPGPKDVLIRVDACAVCRTDLHVIDGELPNPKLPLIPGHQIIGKITAVGSDAKRFEIGDRVGVPWLAWTDEQCEYCRRGQENLCDSARFTGYTHDGGYAEFTIADERFCSRIPKKYSDVEAAPLLCAGLIGFRSLRKTGDSKRLGIFGFGAAAHLIIQVAVYQGREVYVFTRSKEGQQFARSLGAQWAGDSEESSQTALDAAIIFAPSGPLVPRALQSVRKSGIVVCGGIHMSDIPQFPYELLWGERSLCSVANLTRKDAEDFMKIAPDVPVKTFFETFPLAEANEALERFRTGQVRGSVVLIIGRG